jgi:hypothetical protein
VCQWPTDRLTIVGVGRRPVLDAAGASSEGKAIWVIDGNDTRIENVAFTGAPFLTQTVPESARRART